MISKELYSPPTKEDEAVMIMAKNQIEIDEYLLAKEFEEALEEAKEKGFKGTDKEFAESYYRDNFSGGGRADKSFKPSTAKELFDRINKTMILRSQMKPEDVKTIDLLLEKSFNIGKKDE
tara:strand:- start:95 stop:454 length:360 start_codon:yes stop_codon:yes gene_type:complete